MLCLFFQYFIMILFMCPKITLYNPMKEFFCCVNQNLLRKLQIVLQCSTVTMHHLCKTFDSK